jgi:hypothetical protein
LRWPYGARKFAKKLVLLPSAIRRNQFPPVRIEGGPDFNSGRHRVDVFERDDR